MKSSRITVLAARSLVAAVPLLVAGPCFGQLHREKMAQSEGASAAQPRTSGSFVVGVYGDIAGDGKLLQTLFRRVERSSFAGDWPVSRDIVDVGCALAQPTTSLIVVIDGQAWALNNSTRDWVRTASATLVVNNQKLPIRFDETLLPDAAHFVGFLLDVAKRMGCLARPAR